MLNMYCNITKNQALPLVFRVSSNTRCFKPFQTQKPHSLPVFGQMPHQNIRNAEIDGFSIEFHCKLLHTGSRAKSISRRQNSVFSRAKRLSGFSCAKVGESSKLRKFGKKLPWLANDVNRSEKVTTKTSTSIWEESAKNFIPKGGTPLIEGKESGHRSIDIEENRQNSFCERGGSEEEEEEKEVMDDPRWDDIKKRYKRISSPEHAYENPETRRWNKQESWGRRTWKEATESSVPKIIGEGVYGVGPVLAALSAGRREFYALYIQQGLDLSTNNRKKKDKKGFERVLKMAEKIGLSTREISKHDLNMVTDNRPHQGLVLDASPLEMINIKELEPISVEGESVPPLWVALDEVTDPQNLGAIIRSAYFFGASGVILCAKNSAPLSGVVSKASAGSLELMEIRSCKNMMQFLSNSIENGWRVLGGSVSSRAVPLNEVLPGEPTLLVLGSEGTGLRPLVERSCTQLIRIDGNLQEGESEGKEREDFRSYLAVESLNVSVAAGVLLHHLIGNRYDKKTDASE